MAGFGGAVKLTGESEYVKALKEITSNLKFVSSELKLTNTEFAAGDKSVKQTKTAYDSMSESLEEQKNKISELKDKLAQAEKEYGANNDKVKQFKTQLNNAENQLKQMESQTDKSTSELKEMKKGFEETGEGAISFGDILKANVLGDFIVDGISKLGSVVKSVGSALVEIGKQAIDSYADYEQLVGGVETLFEDLSYDVVENANKAYETTGLSANQYMETAMSFAASLNQSLLATEGNIAEAADITDRTIIDMSDNANKMGTDMSMIQSAYQGFAKQNYTMLDNLKLGYGGTKTEMERLIADANKVKEANGEMGDLSIESFADITEAIHIVQTEMGITGTTAKEASETISGSTSAIKSAWQNLLTGLVDDNANFGDLVNNFADSLVTMLNNILPRVSDALLGIVRLIIQSVSTILPQLVPLVSDLLTDMIEIVYEWLPDLMETVSTLVTMLVNGLTTALPQIIPIAAEMITTIINTLLQNLPQILQMGITILVELVEGIAQSLPEIIPAMVDAVILMVETLIDNIDLIIDAGINIIFGLIDGIIEALPDLIDKIPEIIDKLINAVVNNLPKIIEAGITLTLELAKGLIKAIPQLISKIPQIIVSIVKGLNEGISKMNDIGKNLLMGLWDGMKNLGSWLWEKVKGLLGGLTDKIKNFFGIHSPSTLFKDEIGKNLALGIGEGFEDTMSDVNNEMADAIQTDYNLDVNTNLSNGKDNYNMIVSAFKEALTGVKIVMDDEKFGDFVVDKVEGAVYG